MVGGGPASLRPAHPARWLTVRSEPRGPWSETRLPTVFGPIRWFRDKTNDPMSGHVQPSPGFGPRIEDKARVLTASGPSTQRHRYADLISPG